MAISDEAIVRQSTTNRSYARGLEYRYYRSDSVRKGSMWQSQVSGLEKCHIVSSIRESVMKIGASTLWRSF
jgi:hypothetical protein